MLSHNLDDPMTVCICCFGGRYVTVTTWVRICSPSIDCARPVIPDSRLFWGQRVTTHWNIRLLVNVIGAQGTCPTSGSPEVRHFDRVYFDRSLGHADDVVASWPPQRCAVCCFLQHRHRTPLRVTTLHLRATEGCCLSGARRH